jgi:DNA-binding MurR/RpiR family transcriptional regulator
MGITARNGHQHRSLNTESNFDLTGLGRSACRDLESVFERVDPSQFELLSRELLATKANRIICYGVGREGLMMEAIAMRLLELTHQKREDLYTRYTNMK